MIMADSFINSEKARHVRKDEGEHLTEEQRLLDFTPAPTSACSCAPHDRITAPDPDAF
jgi:hypothetical protein